MHLGQELSPLPPNKCSSRWLHFEHPQLQGNSWPAGDQTKTFLPPQELSIKWLVRKGVSENGGWGKENELQSQKANRAGRFLISTLKGQSPGALRSTGGRFCSGAGVRKMAEAGEAGQAEVVTMVQCRHEGPPLCGGTRSSEDGQETQCHVS